MVDNVEFAQETISKSLQVQGEKIFLWCSVIDTGKLLQTSVEIGLLNNSREWLVSRTTGFTVSPLFTSLCAKVCHKPMALIYTS